MSGSGSLRRSSHQGNLYPPYEHHFAKYPPGKLDEETAAAMKKLAKDKMLRALSNVAYAKGAYEKEMDQAALKKEASAKYTKKGTNVNRKELSQNHWKYYLMLEKRFVESIEFVELHEDNFDAFSNGYASLIQP